MASIIETELSPLIQIFFLTVIIYEIASIIETELSPLKQIFFFSFLINIWNKIQKLFIDLEDLKIKMKINPIFKKKLKVFISCIHICFCFLPKFMYDCIPWLRWIVCWDVHDMRTYFLAIDYFSDWWRNWICASKSQEKWEEIR